MKNRWNTFPFNPAHWPVFYGWNILLWGSIGVLLSAPGQTTGVSAFTEPLLRALEINRLELSMAYMAGTLASAFLLPTAGKVFDRLGARWMGAGSCLLLGAVLFLLSRADGMVNALSGIFPHRVAALGIMAVLFFLLRFSGQGVLTLTSRNMVMKWFDRHRGLASGISGVAVAYGFANTPRICRWMIEQHGWSGTWQQMAFLWVLVFVPLLLIFYRDNPEECGLVPDGKTVAHKQDTAIKPQHPFTLKEARSTITFWAFCLPLALHSLYVTAITFHIESVFTEAGLEGARGFLLFPPAALIAIAVNLVGGWLSDRIALRYFLSLFLLALSASMVGFIFLRPSLIPVIIVTHGLSSGLFPLLMNVTWPKYFGRQHLGAISGLNMAMLVFGSAIGPILFSLSLKTGGSYRASLIGCIGIAALLFCASFRARNPQNTQ